jgi:hypothetical protein
MTDDKCSKILEHISETLDEVLAVMKKPENKLLRILDIIGNVVTIASILAIIEIIRNWV